MTGEEFRAIRQSRGETEIECARRLGYTGSNDTVHRLVRRIERGEKEISAQVALRAIELKGED
jgi:transcriptional regulator with XRE-family HTH domain